MSLKTMQEEGFAQDVEDCDWIPDIAARGWIIITKDKNIRRDTLELRAVMASRARYFTLGKADRSATEMVAIVLRHRPTIERLVQHRTPPVVAQINMSEVLLRDANGELHAVKSRATRNG